MVAWKEGGGGKKEVWCLKKRLRRARCKVDAAQRKLSGVVAEAHAKGVWDDINY
jgi:hypothetical protein